MINNIFGDWINKVEDLHHIFINNKPYPHIIIENFLQKNVIENLYNNFPELNNEWFKYNNPLEIKYANNNIKKFHKTIKEVFTHLESSEIINKLSILTGIENLESDPTLHGSGLHLHPRNGKLMLHLDYEKHPILKDKQRRINIILYLNKDWKKEWNGATEMWNKNVDKKVKESTVIFNNALIFQTSEDSWHGIPDNILCPEDTYRKTLAFYYISPLESIPDDKKKGQKNGYREKACFSLRPFDYKDERVLKLMSIRPYRRIEDKDMKKIYPDWDGY